jgi:hypothetical protein
MLAVDRTCVSAFFIQRRAAGGGEFGNASGLPLNYLSPSFIES